MDGELIKKSLCFHGKPMQKIWDDERGSGDLQKIGVPEDGHYAIYMDRQKYFTFQDRAKRLKLHQFLARKAVDLYDKDLGKSIIQSIKPNEEIEKAKQFMAEVPPYEVYLVKHQDKLKRHIYESIKPGDIIYATVPRNKLSSTKFGLTVNVICTGEPKVQLLHEYKLKANVSHQLCGTINSDKSPKPRNNDNNEYLRCEVVEFSIYADRLSLSLQGNSTKNKNLKLGLITLEEMPQLYRKVSENKLEKFEECLRKAKEFENPNYEVLYTLNGLDVNDNFSMMTNLKYEFPRQEYAKELRQVQASKWAFRSVAEGIEYFKIGEHVEAFQCLNKALNIDPRNVEGLVARGALYANKGSFLKAVEDFEKALKLNAYHVNARKYMGETLVALGRSYEEDNRIQEAAKAYRDCLNIIPNHEQARLSLEVIQQRTGASVEPIIKQKPLPSVTKYENSIQQQLQEFEQQQGIVALSSSNEEESSENSSDSEAEVSDDIFLMAKKDPSLSPLSKKMFLHSATMDQQQPAAQFNQPFYMTQGSTRIANNVNVLANEFKLDDDDTESRVQKLLQEAMKHKREKKKSKKSKKSKKLKKEYKSPKDASSILEKINFEEAYNLLGGGLKIESALNDNLKMYEQTIQEIRKRQENLHQTTTSDVATTSRRVRHRSETPPPPPLRANLPTSSTYVYKSSNFGRNNNYSAAPKVQTAPEPVKLSFQIKKPVKVDKFGLLRLATPALENSPTPSPPHTKRRLPSPRPRLGRRSRERSNSKRRISHSRSRSPRNYRGGDRRGKRYRRSSSNSRSRSKSYSRYRSRKRASRSTSRSSTRRHSPSPFVPRGTPSPNSRYRRSRSPSFNRKHSSRYNRSPRSRRSSRSPDRQQSFGKFGNRTWQRPDFKPRVLPPSEGKWLHDKFEEKNDGPSIEEIDEIISKAQKERKQDIISRDKDILKKTNNW